MCGHHLAGAKQLWVCSLVPAEVNAWEPHTIGHHFDEREMGYKRYKYKWNYLGVTPTEIQVTVLRITA